MNANFGYVNRLENIFCFKFRNRICWSFLSLWHCDHQKQQLYYDTREARKFANKNKPQVDCFQRINRNKCRKYHQGGWTREEYLEKARNNVRKEKTGN